MAHGLKIINDAGTVQVDELYKNMALFAKEVSTTNTVISAGLSKRTFTYSASLLVNPIFAVRCADYAVARATLSGGTWTVDVFVNDPSGTAFTLYVFGEPIASADTMGFRVFNASGGLVFDSNLKYLRVIDFWNKPFQSGGTPFETRTYASGLTLAAAVVNLSLAQDASIKYHVGLKYSGNDMVVDKVGYGSACSTFGGPSCPIYRGSTDIMVIDCTNY